MFERLKFTRYALRFERAVRTDDWSPVAACFHPDATYFIMADRLRSDGSDGSGVLVIGRDRIVAVFRDMVDRIDRQYDRRIPRLAGIPRVKGGELVVPWRARYVLGNESVVLTGRSQCRFDGLRIRALSDFMPQSEVDAWLALPYRAGTPPTLQELLVAAGTADQKI